MNKLIACVATAALLFASTACSPSSALVVSLNAIEAAAEAAVPVLTISGTIPAPLAPLVSAYLGSVSAAVNETVTELQSTDTAARKAQVIEGYWATAVIPNLTGAPVNVVAIIQAVDASVKAFLGQLNPVAGTFAAHAIQANAMPALTRGDRSALNNIAKRAHKLQQELNTKK